MSPQLDARILSPRERYLQDLRQPGFSPDHAQQVAVDHLQDLQQELLEKFSARQSVLSRLGRWFGGSTENAVRGLYMWGGVGRGKTFLMDCFFDSLPFPGKVRLHFHRFMQQVHAKLAQLKDHEDPLQIVAREIARENLVICFDEFFVSDIADAMILGRLFEHLFENGVTLVATSNVQPDNLYADGLQRASFLPAIELIKSNTVVLNVDGGVDYRLRVLERAEIYHHPLDDAANENLVYGFEHMAGHWTEAEPLVVEGRSIDTVRLADGVAWFRFESICGGPRSQLDYIEIARVFHTVLVSGIPVFNETLENEARRFISLVDEFYDRAVKLMVSAETGLDDIYQGRKLEFEFQRTRSRLLEMQSHEYLAREHRP